MAKPSIIHRAFQLGRHVIPAVVRPAHTLWHEVIGFLFLALAALPIPSGIRAFRELDSGNGNLLRLVLTVAFVCIMAAYGISSFRRARKISRS